MDSGHAFTLLGRLAANVHGWDESRTMLWIDKMRDLTDPDAAAAAVEQLVDTWTQPGAPSWAHFRDLYDSILRNHRLTRQALPAPKNGLTKAEYMTRLRDRASQGDAEAKAELAAWARFDRSPLGVSVQAATR